MIIMIPIPMILIPAIKIFKESDNYVEPKSYWDDDDDDSWDSDSDWDSDYSWDSGSDSYDWDSDW